MIQLPPPLNNIIVGYLTPLPKLPFEENLLERTTYIRMVLSNIQYPTKVAEGGHGYWWYMRWDNSYTKKVYRSVFN